MKKAKELYAIHQDGRKLYRPEWDHNGEIVETGLPTAAVSVDQDGKTHPEGSTWIRSPRGWGYLPGWTVVGEPQPKTQTMQAPSVTAPERTCRTGKRRTRRTCVCTKTFLAKRADAKFCSNACQLRSSRH
jgi:hypothetical protein